jgi:hypothetical protein
MKTTLKTKIFLGAMLLALVLIINGRAWAGILVGLGGLAFVFFANRSTIMALVRSLNETYRIKGDVQTPEAKKILAGAIYSDQQGAYLDTLAAGIDDKLHTILREWWDINDRATAVAKLDYLKEKAYAFYFPTVCKAFRAATDDARAQIFAEFENTAGEEDAQKAFSQTHNLLESIKPLTELKIIKDVEDVEKYGVVGWDVGRLIFVARLCYDAKYITEQEAWGYIDAAYAQAQKTFQSWEALAKSYVIGRFLWKGADAADGIAEVANGLLTNPKSPWQQVAWK